MKNNRDYYQKLQEQGLELYVIRSIDLRTGNVNDLGREISVDGMFALHEAQRWFAEITAPFSQSNTPLRGDEKDFFLLDPYQYLIDLTQIETMEWKKVTKSTEPEGFGDRDFWMKGFQVGDNQKIKIFKKTIGSDSVYIKVFEQSHQKNAPKGLVTVMVYKYNSDYQDEPEVMWIGVASEWAAKEWGDIALTALISEDGLFGYSNTYGGEYSHQKILDRFY